jgi:lipid kinase YegS
VTVAERQREKAERTTTRVILNGKGASDPEVRDAIHRVRQDGHDVEVRCTWESGDATRYAEQAVADGVDILVAGGGDGTIHEIVNGLMAADAASDVVLGIVPLGTANDLARGCGIPPDPYDALTLAVDGRPVPVDVPSANGVSFLNLASGGFGAEVTAGTPDGVKQVIGSGAYALVGVVTAAKLEPYDGSIELPDGDHDGPFIALGIGNGRYAGGGLPVTPDALLDDGLVDLIVVRNFDAADVGTVLGELRSFADPGNRFVCYHQTDRLSIRMSEPMPVNLDGESYSWEHIDVEVRHRALRIVLPEDCPLIDRH